MMIPEQNTQPVIHEAVGVFDNPVSLQDALDELQENGFMAQELSVLAGEDAIMKKIGHTYRRVEEAEDDPRAPRSAFTAEIVFGWAKGAAFSLPIYIAVGVAAAVTAAADPPYSLLPVMVTALCSGVVGFFLARIVAKQRNQYISAQLKRGGLALWVNLRSPLLEEKAKAILRKHAARDVHVHDLPLYG